MSAADIRRPEPAGTVPQPRPRPGPALEPGRRRSHLDTLEARFDLLANRSPAGGGACSPRLADPCLPQTLRMAWGGVWCRPGADAGQGQANPQSRAAGQARREIAQPRWPLCGSSAATLRTFWPGAVAPAIAGRPPLLPGRVHVGSRLSAADTSRHSDSSLERRDGPSKGDEPRHARGDSRSGYWPGAGLRTSRIQLHGCNPIG